MPGGAILQCAVRANVFSGNSKAFRGVCVCSHNGRLWVFAVGTLIVGSTTLVGLARISVKMWILKSTASTSSATPAHCRRSCLGALLLCCTQHRGARDHFSSAPNERCNASSIATASCTLGSGALLSASIITSKSSP